MGYIPHAEPAGLSAATQASLAATYGKLADLQSRGMLVPLSASNTGAQNSAALLDANTSASTFGAALILPPGTFQLDPTVITPRDRLTIRGAGAAYQSGVGTKLVNTSTTGGDLLSLSGGVTTVKAWEITLEDFELVGVTGSGNGLVLCSAGTTGAILGNVTVRRVTSHGHGVSGFKAQGRIDQLTFEQTVARDNTLHGYDLTMFNLLSEAVFLNAHGSANTDHGLYVGGTVFACTIVGGEFSSNGQIGYEMSSAPGGNANAFTAIGVHSEKNGLYHAQFGSDSVNSVVLDSCHFLDNSTTGITTFINVRVRAPKSMVVRNCVGSGKTDGLTLVAETGSGRIPVLEGSTVTTSTGTAYLRKTSGGTLTNDWRGGTTTNLPSTTYSRVGDTYYDTTAATSKRFDGTSWITTGGGSTGPTGPAGPAGAAGLQRTGYWHRLGTVYSTSSSLGNGTLRAVPMTAAKAITLDQLSVEITAAGNAGAVVRIGVYADDVSGGYPGSLIVDAGTVAADAIGTPTLTLGSPITLVAGTVYWLAAVVQNAATTQPTVRNVTAGVPFAPTGTAVPSGSGTNLGWTQNSVSGALPTPFTSIVASAGSAAAIGYHLT